MLQFLNGLHGLAQFDLILQEEHLGRLLPALRIARTQLRLAMVRRVRSTASSHFDGSAQAEIVLCAGLHAEQRELAIHVLQIARQRATNAVEHDGVARGQD